MRLRGSPVLPDTLLDVSGTVPAAAVQGLLTAVRTGQFTAIQELVTGLIAEGYPAQEILLQLQAVLLAEDGTPDSGRHVQLWLSPCPGWGVAAGAQQASLGPASAGRENVSLEPAEEPVMPNGVQSALFGPSSPRRHGHAPPWPA